jgi:hypothetical protein
MSQDETIIDQFVKAEMMSTFFMYNHETQATHCKVQDPCQGSFQTW